MIVATDRLADVADSLTQRDLSPILDDSDEDFWEEPGHFSLAECASTEDLLWLRKVNAAYGHNVGRGVVGHSTDGDSGTGFLYDEDRATLRKICGRILRAVANYEGEAHFLDLAIISNTAPSGHKPHIDNEKLVRNADGTCCWVPGFSGHRTWSASVMLSEPSEYGGGELVFYDARSRKPRVQLKQRQGAGFIFRGDRWHAHGVNPITWGTRLVLVVFLRGDPRPQVPRLYTRAGLGRAVYLEPSVKQVTQGLCFIVWAGFMRFCKARGREKGDTTDSRQHLYFSAWASLARAHHVDK